MPRHRHGPQNVITGFDPVIIGGTVPLLMAGSVAGHDVVDNCADESVIAVIGITLMRASSFGAGMAGHIDTNS
ncbi:MAG: hypothetical protein ABSA58_00650 [Acetobacteraceae bacterium]|jgi:hypothetical protein